MFYIGGGMKPEIITFTKVSNGKGRLLFEGYCHKCDKVRYHRFDGETIYDSRYRCMGCGNITTVPL
jgi:hypothetical protein